MAWPPAPLASPLTPWTARKTRTRRTGAVPPDVALGTVLVPVGEGLPRRYGWDAQRTAFPKIFPTQYGNF
jgi:hypothetical protein